MRHIAIAILALAGLAACAGPEPPPAIDFDEAAFVPAAPAAEPPPPVRIVRIPEPLPLPGQLKPLPAAREATGPGADRPPEDRVARANEAAAVEPEAKGYVNAMQVYPYAPGALYQLYAAPERVSAIALQPGETVVAVSAGDTTRWVIADTVSGSGEDALTRILVKPVAEDLATNLVIVTDRRAYHLELASTPGTYMASVSWRYPHDELLALERRNRAAEDAPAPTIASGLDLADLRFRYRIEGDDPPWRPVRVFDDTRKVYIQFPARLDQGEAPPLFTVGPSGEAELVNYRVKGRTYIVDRLFAAAELRLGEDPQQVVRIARTDARPAGAGKDED